MAIIDFKEIPSSIGGEQSQDFWALFARGYFEALHFPCGILSLQSIALLPRPVASRRLSASSLAS